MARLDGTPFPSSPSSPGAGPAAGCRRSARRGSEARAGDAALETAYCAEVVAVTYEDMGLLPRGRQPNWYDPGRFWSGDELELCDGFTLGDEIAVDIPAP